MLEDSLETFLRTKGYSVPDFFEVLHAHPVDGEAIAAVLNAASSFDNFIDLLVDARAGTWAGAACITYS